jgi:hypothetical protein
VAGGKNWAGRKQTSADRRARPGHQLKWEGASLDEVRLSQHPAGQSKWRQRTESAECWGRAVDCLHGL